ncbi:hypothetical protein [Belliella filtrata]|nr:hypothetical protein [Belliella filtrata]
MRSTNNFGNRFILSEYSNTKYTTIPRESIPAFRGKVDQYSKGK